MPTSVKIAERLSDLGGWLESDGAERLLVITTPARRFLDRLPLDGYDVEVFDRAAVHVPRAVVEDAAARLSSYGADTVISLGGGSTTGLAKALRLEAEVRFVAIPTTYSCSEMTNIWGMTDAGEKRTGRDDRVRPDLVIHEPTLFRTMPKRLTVTSLLNALAHPISALSTNTLEGDSRTEALRAVDRIAWALELLLEDPTSPDGRRSALLGAARAGAVLDGGQLGLHHRVAHLLGGRFGLDHGGLHAALLPHFVLHLFRQDRALYEELASASGHPDLAAALYEALTRAEAARSLVELGVSHAAFEALSAEDERLRQRWAQDARYGRRPSIHTRRWELRGRPSTSVRGPAPEDASRVVVALHGRGSNADRFMREVLSWVGHDPTVTIVAPQAPGNEWYATSYRASAEEMGEALSASLEAVEATLAHVLSSVPAERVFLAGFSQGACLATELFARSEAKLGGLLASAGARIGPVADQPALRRDLSGARVVLGVSEGDPWVTPEDVAHAGQTMSDAGAEVGFSVSPGEAHEVTAGQRMLFNEALFGRSLREGPRGFGNAHEAEALEGSLPRRQNSPRRVPYGLYAEQINGTGFTAKRSENLRTWLYRIRPSAQHTAFVPIEHDRLRSDWADTPADPNLIGYRPLPAPERATDFIDGLATFGGFGHPRDRRGCAIHLYAANRSMEHRCFYDADGDLLIIPQQGGLLLQTELGMLEVSPGQIALLPRGLKVSVHLEAGFARGYVGEVYGRHFTLPERGPVGSNGLADPRHFRAPAPFFEDRAAPGYRVTVKHSNELFEATQDHSPYDVAAWHGDYAPYVYDLMDFSPVGNTRFDHPDPSIHLVLGAPLDEQSADSLDFVFFPPRWDPTEHTFRPAFFHRNAVTEFNGIIEDPTLAPDGPFTPGCYYLTPSMTAHGVLARAVQSALRRSHEMADRPVRIGNRSMWFQLETAAPIGLTSWARGSANRILDWPSAFGAYRTHFSDRQDR